MSQQDPSATTADRARALITQAEQSFQAGRLGEAEGLLRSALKIQPENADALFALGLVAYRAGQTDAAIRLIEEAISFNPSAARFHTNLCALYELRGQPAKAIEHGRVAVTLRPRSSEAHNNLGVAYLAAGDASSAVEHFSAAITADPRNVDALANRARAHLRLQMESEAEADGRAAVAAGPRHAAAHSALGGVLLARRKFADAEAVLRAGLALAPKQRDMLLNLALALRGQKRLDAALDVADQATQAYPQHAEPLSLAASICLERGAPEAALGLAERALALDPDHVETLLIAGRAHDEEQRPDKAAIQFQRALALQPRHAAAYHLLAQALRQDGAFEAAHAAYEKALALDPDNCAVLADLAETKIFRSASDPHFAAMTALLAREDSLPANQRSLLHVARGKACDDLERHDEAFRHFESAARLRQAENPYAEGEALRLFQRIRDAFTPECVERLSGHGDTSSLPIFIVGMPRAGTTLVEQMLASHPDVRGAGEVPIVREAVGEMRARLGGQRAFPELMDGLMLDDLRLLGQTVATRLARRVPGAPRVTDKMTSNFFFLGLIHLALPRARIIHVRRHPLDTCLSCHARPFETGVAYAQDLETLGRYYAAYQGLMAHWRGVLPADAVLDVDYESIVRDPEGEARRLLAHCDLRFDPAVLSFHTTRRPVRTISNWQVRQPLYGSAVGRWRKYARHLEPLIRTLGPLADTAG